MTNSNEQPRISCIIPAYNEAERIAGVLDAVIANPLVSEVIVVNDGSTDETEAIIKMHRVTRLISYSPNRGKSHAMMVGIQAASNDLLLILDSDLIGLRSDDIAALAMPVISGNADVSISMRKNSLLVFRLFGLDFVSGERCFPRHVIPDLDHLDRIPGYGLESFMNRIIIKEKLRIAVVKWPHVIHPMKTAKYGFLTGIKNEARMILQIISVLGVFGIARQFLAMLSLKVAD